MCGQEICDNAIDDDNDGLIDLNDDACECDNTIQFTAVTGSICGEYLNLVLDDADATSFQWYKNGIALIGETGSELLLEDTENQEGNYQVMVIKPDGCYLSEVYLGEHNICQGDTIFFGGFALTFTGFFQETNQGVNGCDSTTTIDVIVQDPLPGYIAHQICNGQTFTHDGVEYDTPGLYDVETTTTIGCDSLYTVHIIEGDLEIIEIDASICPGESYDDFGISEDEAGTYESIVNNPNGCDTMITVNLTLSDSPTLIITERLCPGDTYDQYGILTDLPGNYEAILENTAGCDTVLNLIILEEDQPTLNFSENICAGDVYEEYGLSETESGSYVSYLSASEGCDTLVTIDLSVEEIPTAIIQHSICTGDTYIFHDIEETESGTYTTSYDYGGICDSLITVELLVTETIELDLVRTICQGEFFDQYGIYADETGDYQNTITNTIGCDSIITLNLTVASPTESFLTEVICPDTFFDLNDIHENTSGSYQTVIENVNGCDSTINVELTVLEVAYEEVAYSICEGDELQLNGETYTEEGIYDTQLLTTQGCDSTLVVDISVIQQPTAFREVYICEGETYEYGPLIEDQEGLYEFNIENQDACDSIITIQLLVIEPSEGVALDYYHTVSYGNPIDIRPEFMGSGVTDITWTNEEGEEIGSGPVLENFMTLEDMNIALNGTDANGCPVEARAIIDVSLEIDIFVPTIFTPDGDGNNDRFQLYGGPTVSQIKEIYIYDKWGELMHSAKNVPATDEYIGWDGMHRGKPAIQGAYAYIAIFDIVTGDEKTVKGMVTLVY